MSLRFISLSFFFLIIHIKKHDLTYTLAVVAHLHSALLPSSVAKQYRSVAEVGGAACGEHARCWDVTLTHRHVHARAEGLVWNDTTKSYVQVHIVSM